MKKFLLTLIFIFISSSSFSKNPFNGEKFWLMVITDITLNNDNSFSSVKSVTNHKFHNSEKECEKNLVNYVFENSNLKKGPHGLYVGGYTKKWLTTIRSIKCVELISDFFYIK